MSTVKCDPNNIESLRDVYGCELLKLGETNKDVVVLDADLSSSTRTSLFAKKFPDRFFNMGIAEADMMSTAAGLAASGKIAFASTFAIFATGRPWDQIRQSICVDNRNVKIVATHGGITVGEDGPTHQAMEDIALMRMLPNMRVLVPADAKETIAMINFVATEAGPFYIRLSREKFVQIYDDYERFNLGVAKTIRTGSDIAIISTGLMVYESLKAADLLAKDGINVTVVNMSSIEPLDSKLLLEIANSHRGIVTAEEGSVVGGLGSAVAELLSESRPLPIIRVGMRAGFGKSGAPAELLKFFKMDATAIFDAVRKVIAFK
ncbi:MAG: transketolase family protein [Nitrospinota bacterium]